MSVCYSILLQIAMRLCKLVSLYFNITNEPTWGFLHGFSLSLKLTHPAFHLQWLTDQRATKKTTEELHTRNSRKKEPLRRSAPTEKKTYNQFGINHVKRGNQSCNMQWMMKMEKTELFIKWARLANGLKYSWLKRISSQNSLRLISYGSMWWNREKC